MYRKIAKGLVVTLFFSCTWYTFRGMGPSLSVFETLFVAGLCSFGGLNKEFALETGAEGRPGALLMLSFMALAGPPAVLLALPLDLAYLNGYALPHFSWIDYVVVGILSLLSLIYVWTPFTLYALIDWIAGRVTKSHPTPTS